MNIKKIAIAILISVLISAGLYYGVVAMSFDKAIAVILKDKFDLTMCVMIGSVFGVMYLIMSYRKVGIKDEHELDAKKQEYFYNSFTDKEKDIINSMSEEDKNKFYVSYEQVLSEPKKNKLANYMFAIQKDKVPAFMKVLRKLAMIGLVVFIGYYGYETYKDIKPAMDKYMAKANATYEDRMLYIEGLPPIQLNIELDGFKPKQSDVDAFINAFIKKQPQFLLDNCSIIKVYNMKKWDSVKKLNGIAAFAYAFALSADNSISIQWDYDNYNNTSITHELWHLIDFKAGTDNHIYSHSQAFTNLYNSAPNSITEYGGTNPKEFFAEAGAMYVNNPKMLKQKNKDVYNYFDELFEQYMK